MEQAQSQLEDLLTVGARYALDTHALCQDIARYVFPTAITPPTEAAVSAVSAKIMLLMADIERYLTGTSTAPSQPASWPLLSKSGLLREADLIDFVFARTLEDRLEHFIGDAAPSFASRLLDHHDSDIAQAARIFLAADSLQRQTRGNAHMALPPELLHKLCWRIVAAFEVKAGERSMAMISAARQLLGNYDEAQTVKAAARKIVHLVGDSEQLILLKPDVAGLHLHVASISAALGLEHDHILLLIGANSSAPYSIMLSALGIPKEQAVQAVILLRGGVLGPAEADAFNRFYSVLNQAEAMRAVNEWALARARYLALGAL